MFFPATPDETWVLLLASAGLICVEFVRPGLVVPGILGGVGFLTAALHLEHFGIALPSLVTAAMAVLAAVIASIRARLWLWLAITSGAFISVTGRLLIAGDVRISWPAAIAGAPAGVLLTWLAMQAGRAWRNKRTDNPGVSR